MVGSPEAKIWHRMYRHIVRGNMKSKLNIKIYDKYYKNRIVAMYREQKEIAEFLEIKSRSHISECIKSMTEKGIIIAHPDKWRSRRITVYELGTHDGSVNRWETIHLFTYFHDLERDKELKRLGA